MGRSKSLQLSDSLITKPPRISLGAELLSLHFLLPVGGDRWKAAVNELQQQTSADLYDVFLP